MEGFPQNSREIGEIVCGQMYVKRSDTERDQNFTTPRNVRERKKVCIFSTYSSLTVVIKKDEIQFPDGGEL